MYIRPIFMICMTMHLRLVCFICNLDIRSFTTPCMLDSSRDCAGGAAHRGGRNGTGSITQACLGSRTFRRQGGGREI